MGVAVVLLANVFFGGGKCPNLGVVNVRILGVVNVLLANDSQSFAGSLFPATKALTRFPGRREGEVGGIEEAKRQPLSLILALKLPVPQVLKLDSHLLECPKQMKATQS